MPNRTGAWTARRSASAMSRGLVHLPRVSSSPAAATSALSHPMRGRDHVEPVLVVAEAADHLAEDLDTPDSESGRGGRWL